MSFKKMSLKGLAILSLTLMASLAGWCGDSDDNAFEEQMGSEFTGIATTLILYGLPKILGEIRETSGNDLSVCETIASFGFMSRKEARKIMESVFAEEPSSRERRAQAVTIYCMSDEKLREKWGFLHKKLEREGLVIAITGRLLEMKTLSEELVAAAQAIVDEQGKK